MIREVIDYITIKVSGYFDPAYYLLRYPDCRLADIDPLWHFVKYGWREGRNPSSEFDTEYYLEHNPDIRVASINPLVHYIRYGRKEGRIPRPVQAAERSIAIPRKQPHYLRRVLYAVGIQTYRLIPARYRQSVLHWLYTYLGFLFKGLPDYEGWLISCRFAVSNLNVRSNLVDLETVGPARDPKGRIAIHLHVFYPDLAKEIAGYLRNMPFPYDLYISVTTEQALGICQRSFSALPLCRKVDIRLVPNRGRDLAPMFCTFGDELSQYDYIAHLHTKKSLYNRGATEGWREYLYRSLLGSEDQIRKIIGLLQSVPPYGIVYPQNYFLLPYWANTWLANRELGKAWCLRLGIYDIPRGYFDYPAGSMFWARKDALAPLFRAKIQYNDFPEESGQTDGTLSHTIERLFVLCSLKQGMRPAIIRDKEHPGWSAWRFDHYVNRPYEAIVSVLHAPKIKLIVFDVFDTLLSRPLLNPESVKDIVARRIGGEAGSLYKQYRNMAEALARREKGLDVGIEEIYTCLRRLTGLPDVVIGELRDTEEKVEEASVEPRQEVVTLFQDALRTGKPVVLATDMFLPRENIERFLRRFGIEGWKELFVSGEIGLRKDNRTLYDHILSRYTLEPSQMLVIGDDERSDIQIPCDMGASFIHVIRPVELARGLPRFAGLITSHERSDDLNAQITLGLVVRKNFASITYPSFDPASLVPVTPYNWGYSLVGPLLVSFVSWLLERSREDGIARLYFLAREGRLIKEIYDCWINGITEAPQSDYLVVSRRAAGVAAIAAFEDIVEIARTIYFPNTLENFLHTRYGLSLDSERWQTIQKISGWKRDSMVAVQNRKVEHLVPFLQMLQSEIMARADKERQALLKYLEEKGLTRDDRQAVVDVGYGGSVQGYLNRLLMQRVHGYYMITDDRAAKVAQTHNVILRGCFLEDIVMQSPNAPAMARHSFDLEKLLSINEPQVECYDLDEMGRVRACYRDLSSPEMEAHSIREEIRRGALDYAKDARQIRETMLPDFRPSCWTAQMLIEAFLTQKSDAESDLLSRIVLDDHYCGRGLIA